MNVWRISLALALVLSPLTGCVGSEDVESTNAVEGASEIVVSEVPEGATVETIEEGKQIVWDSVDLPFEREVEIPPNTTIARATAEVADGASLYVHLENADTGRRRCNVPYVTSWSTPRTGEMTCSGLTAVDPLPAKWTVEVSGPAQADQVRLELLTTPPEGPASQLNLSELSMPTHDLQETESFRVASEDGTELYTEVTLPEGDGPWPVVLASSPYNSGYHASGTPSLWEYFVQDWAKRGYAVVVSDVRGTGYSDGCMEVWGPNEQADQKVLVDWVAEQEWSTGDVGFYGQSYVGTTPVEAAVQAPEALDAIIAVAPVINAYDDWHFGGVPNGENVASPVFYQGFTGGASDIEAGDPATTALYAANGVCDPTLTARANDPRAIHDEYYEVRNFSQGADDVEAATLYTHGFEDPNVKSQMITDFFNAVDAPKLGILGHWIHQHPARADNEVLFLAWMDEHVKGKEMGFDRVANVTVTTDDGNHRTGESFPPTDADERTLYPVLGSDELGDEPEDGSETIVLDPTGLSGQEQAPASADAITLTREIRQSTHVSGRVTVDLAATLDGAENAHVAAFLYDTSGAERVLVSFGMANLAHRNGHDSYEPVGPEERVTMQLKMLPTEYELSPGDEIELVIRAAQPTDWSVVDPGRTGMLTLHAGDGNTEVDLPTLTAPSIAPAPVDVRS